ncbi:hypothetical protein yc1106_07528 [Curvularia clavata]|uniref:Uncharacterized protein n=1 Tax=Curvularia clavata TaxID=95742 RepID=A0A9Q8ZF04_CURCL|nr:hypothetical protein yc1106_07528 [Curvularia clavata]
MKDYKMARKWAAGARSVIPETATARRKLPDHLTFNTIKPLPYTRHFALPPMPRPTPPAIRSVQGECSPQAEGYGPIPKYDNILGFRLSPEVHNVAVNAAIPSGYNQSFAFANGSFVGTQYLGHYELQSYDTLECAKRCNEWGQSVNSTNGGSTTQAGAQNPDQTNATTMENGEAGHERQTQEQLCQSFNVYFERSPAIHLGPECREAESRTVIKCALWAEPLRIEGATNIGYREWDFDVAIAGSNGYNLEKHTEAESMAPGRRMSKAVVVALFVGQLVLAIMIQQI